MADSNITKRVLAMALKTAMESQPFSKITVGDICGMCGMNRKSFYYHFKDKYELVNWIYYTEFIEVIRRKHYESEWELAEDLCRYLYENRDFYRKTLKIEGQTSFTEHFEEVMSFFLMGTLKDEFDKEEEKEFFVGFYRDAFVCAIKKWLTGKDSMSADAFLELLKKCLVRTSEVILGKAEEILQPRGK